MSDQEKIRLLNIIKEILLSDHPEFLEENTTGNFLIFKLEEVIEDLKPKLGLQKL